jgi:hypothetical protein
MDFTGHIVGLAKDFGSSLWHLTLEMDKDTALECIQDYGQDTRLAVHIAKYRKKRSLDANAYMWALLTRIANHTDIKSTKEELYENFLIENNLYYKDDEGYVVITLPARIDVSKIEGHWKFMSPSPDGKFKSYAMLKGSSMMDSKEFSELLDSIVKAARKLGIETETDSDLQIMLEEWGRKYAETRKRNN